MTVPQTPIDIVRSRPTDIVRSRPIEKKDIPRPRTRPKIDSLHQRPRKYTTRSEITKFTMDQKDDQPATLFSYKKLYFFSKHQFNFYLHSSRLIFILLCSFTIYFSNLISRPNFCTCNFFIPMDQSA